MLCRVVHMKTGWVIEIDPARVEQDVSGISFIRLTAMEPAFLMTNLAEKFRSDSFKQETPQHHDEPHHD